jgi:hypothetical protein
VAKFMLIIHKTPGDWEEMSAAEIQRKMDSYQAWASKLRSSGRYVSGEKLGEEGGKLMKLHHGRPLIVDGPFMEAKEVVAGYMIFRAANYDEALELTRDCPFLEDGPVVLRQTDPAGCGGE